MALETDDGFHEIQLTGKQLVFLFMAATVVSVVIFLCGVLVGRGVRMDQLAHASGQAGVDPGAEIAARPIRESQAGVPLPELPAAQAAPAPPVVSELADEANVPAPPKPEPVAPVVEQRPAPPPAAPPPPATATTATKPTPPPPSATPPSSSSAARSSSPPASAPTPAASTAKPAPPAGPGGWQVQLAAYGARSEADAYVRRLATKGFKAYVTTAPGGANMFRVRVGPFPSRAEANAMAARIQKSEGITPWVSRE